MAALAFETETAEGRAASRARLVADLNAIKAPDGSKRTLRTAASDLLLTQHNLEDALLKLKGVGQDEAGQAQKEAIVGDLRNCIEKLHKTRNLLTIGLNFDMDLADKYAKGDGGLGLDPEILKDVQKLQKASKSSGEEKEGIRHSPYKRRSERNYKFGTQCKKCHGWNHWEGDPECPATYRPDAGGYGHYGQAYDGQAHGPPPAGAGGHSDYAQGSYGTQDGYQQYSQPPANRPSLPGAGFRPRYR